MKRIRQDVLGLAQIQRIVDGERRVQERQEEQRREDHCGKRAGQCREKFWLWIQPANSVRCQEPAYFRVSFPTMCATSLLFSWQMYSISSSPCSSTECPCIRKGFVYAPGSS